MKKLLTWIPLATLVLAAITLALRFRQARPEVEASVVSAEMLPLPPSASVPDLTIAVTLHGQPVERLWILRIKLANTGDVTILAQGPRQNTIEHEMIFGFPNGFTILDVKKEKSTFACEVQNINSQLCFNFDQWRKGESSELLVILSTKKDNDERPNILTVRRDLIDGDVVTKDVSLAPLKTRKPLLDYLPSSIAKASRYFVLVPLLFFSIIVAIFSCLKDLFAFAAYRRWWSVYGDEFRAKIQESNLSEEIKKLANSDPNEFFAYAAGIKHSPEFGLTAMRKFPEPPRRPKNLSSLTNLAGYCIGMFLVVVIIGAMICGLIIY